FGVSDSLPCVNRRKKYVLPFLFSVVRGLARNVQAYDPPNSGDVGWTLPLAGAAAPRVCTALAGTRPPEPVRAGPGEGRPRKEQDLVRAGPEEGSPRGGQTNPRADPGESRLKRGQAQEKAGPG
ncbi:hypothetical protein Cadr_000028156, partial [Camelus dromedarius]